MDEDIVLGEIYISQLVEAKLNGKHGLEADEILDACKEPIRAAWSFDVQRGWRLLVEGVVGNDRRIEIVLYPTSDPTVWNLGTAFIG